MPMKKTIPFWASLFLVSNFVLAGKYLSILYPSFNLPFWLALLMFLTALESSYFATFFLTRQTPFLVIILEFGLFLVPIYLISGGIGVKFFLSSAILFLTWVGARSYGHQILTMERQTDYLADQGASTVSWEYESLSSRETEFLPMEYFWGRFLALSLFVAILAVIVRSKNLPIEPWLQLRLNLLGAFMIGSGLVLQGTAYLLRLQILWKHAQTPVDQGLSQVWLKNLKVFSLLLVIVLCIIPVDYSPLTAAKLGGYLQSLGQSNEVVMPPIPAEPNPQVFNEQMEAPMEMGEPNFVGFFMAFTLFLILVSLAIMLVFVAGYVVTLLAKGELERLKGLPKLAATVYLSLSEQFKKWFHQLRKLNFKPSLGDYDRERFLAQGASWLEPLKIKRKRDKPNDLRAMYRLLWRQGKKMGFLVRQGTTPAEYGQILQEQLPQEQGQVAEFLRGYHKTRYGLQDLMPREKEYFLAKGKEVIEQIERLKEEL